MKGRWFVPTLFLAGGCWISGLAPAAMNPGENSVLEITHERDNVQSMTPEQIQRSILETRERRNAELRAQMSRPPTDFAHYANPPIINQPKRSWRDQLFTSGEPLPLLIVKTLAFMVAGTLLLSWLVYRLLNKSSPKTSP